MELQAYYLMAYEHFYLGNVDKFKFYIQRYENGIVEADDSVLKKMFENAEKSQAKANNRAVGERSKKNEKAVINLPSPSQSSNMINKKPTFSFESESRCNYAIIHLVYGSSTPEVTRSKNGGSLSQTNPHNKSSLSSLLSEPRGMLISNLSSCQNNTIKQNIIKAKVYIIPTYYREVLIC